MSVLRFILGSRSPQRLQLLSQLVPREQIEVCPPACPEEQGFDELTDLADIQNRLVQIATHKAEQVRRQVADNVASILCADTTILGRDDQDRKLHVLGQPPEPDWQPTVREWFGRFYFGRTHFAVTAVVILSPRGNCAFHVLTKVKMCPTNEALLTWYLTTGESVGKAGGYALQGTASLFVDAVQGSLSNVVGLPLRETRQALQSLGLL